ncbi:MAG: acyl-CoA dehydrogenase family protein [Cytophagales bacterium]|nr:acyl-CoA dehydrogenase family protein [Cytophagales bacterium]
MRKDLPEILDQFRAFMAENLTPLEEKYHNRPWDEVVPHLDQVREKAKAAGLWTPQIPEEYGGMGLSVAEFGEVCAVLGMSPYGFYSVNCQAPDAGNMELLIEFGTDEQKKQFLDPLTRGEIRSCFAMTEPEFAGSNPTMLGTTAIQDGDEFVINGHKWFTSSADGASFTIVMAVTDPDGDNPHKKATQILVPLDNPGYKFVRNIPIMGEEGSGWHSHAEVRFENCRVPASNVLGAVGEGFALAQKRLGPGRIHHCMRWMGMCERAMEFMCERAATRVIAPGKVLGDQQAIQFWIAESRAEINAARLMVQDAAQKIDTVGASSARQEISIIKFYCANVLQNVLDRAIQVHGAYGITDDLLISSWYRLERGARIYDGADEVHKARVARDILKKYRKK